MVLPAIQGCQHQGHIEVSHPNPVIAQKATPTALNTLSLLGSPFAHRAPIPGGSADRSRLRRSPSRQAPKEWRKSLSSTILTQKVKQLTIEAGRVRHVHQAICVVNLASHATLPFSLKARYRWLSSTSVRQPGSFHCNWYCQKLWWIY